jgi:hypothetical protein
VLLGNSIQSSPTENYNVWASFPPYFRIGGPGMGEYLLMKGLDNLKDFPLKHAEKCWR